MVRKKRTRPPGARESSAIKESSHQVFDVQLVMVRSGTQKASGYHVHGSPLLPERDQQQGVGGSSVPHSPLYSQQGGLGSRQHQSTAQVQKLYQQLVIHDPSSTSQAIQPVPWSRLVRFQKRPSIGTFGTGCTVKTNHFVVNVFNKDLYQYDVCISPGVRSCGVNHAVMGGIVALYRQSHFGGRLPAYDGQKRLYTAGPLPFSFMTFQIELQDEQDSLGDELALQRHATLFEVVIKFAARVELRPLDMYIAGEQTDEPQIALQVLGTVLRELPIPRYSPIAQSFYSESDQRLGEGLEIQRGFYQSIRPTQKGLLLNIDVSYTAFMKPLPVIDFVAQLLNRDISYRPFCVSDHLKINKALEGVKVQVTHGDNMGKKYRVFGLTSQATEGFQVDEKYHFNIQYSALPLLKVGNQQRPNYLPMEVCKIVEGQSYSKQLSEKQMTTLLKVACQYPQDREEDILQIMNHNKYDAHPHAKEFGIKIEKKLISLKARVLPPPWLKFHDSGMKTKLLPRMGLWNMMRKKMFNGGRVNNWTCINFCWDVQKSTAMRFCHELAITCLVSGMDFSVDPVLPVVTAKT